MVTIENKLQIKQTLSVWYLWYYILFGYYINKHVQRWHAVFELGKTILRYEIYEVM